MSIRFCHIVLNRYRKRNARNERKKLQGVNYIIPKGKHEDDIPLSDRAIEIARRHLRSKHPKAFLFINPNTGRGYLPATIYKLWKATESPVNFHEAARHSFATQLAKNGATPQQIQRLCRHRDIRTTMQYVHMDLTDLRDLVNNRCVEVSLESVRKEKKANENK